MAITRGHWRKAGLTAVGVIATLLAVELGLRAGLSASTWDRLGNPAAYFDPLCQADHWRALRRGAWGATLHRVTPSEQHPQLGWTPDTATLDSWGALPTQDAPDDPNQTIALFGDSYVFGTTPSGTRISDALQQLRPQARVLNFGVGGYGLDQIALRLEDRLSVLSPGDHIIIGVLTTDIDRSILPVRDAPKPWFSLTSAGQMILHRPSQTSTTQWFEDHPISANSVLWRRLMRTMQLQAARGTEATQPACRVSEKKAMSHALLARMGAVCRDAALQCTLLSLYRPIDISQGAGWRSQVLRTAPSHGLRLIDTQPLMASLSEDWRGLYGQDNHPNPAGNRQLARWIHHAISESEAGK